MTHGKKITEQATKAEPPIEKAPKAPRVPLDFKTLNAMPNTYALALWRIRERLTELAEKLSAKSDKSFALKTAEYLEEFAQKLDDAFKPAPPKHLDDAYSYAKSKKYSGTYIALLNAVGNLIKVVIVEKGSVWTTFPEVKLEERPVQIEMNGKFLTIAGTDFGVTDSNPQGGKSVSKAVVKAVPFATDIEKIFEYKNGEIVR